MPAAGPKVDSRAPGGRLEGTQLAALPGYQSDPDVAPSRIEVSRGFIGNPPRRPTRATAAVQVRRIARHPSFKDLPPRRILDLQPMAAAFEPGSYSLADLVADRDWRKRTSETLNRLFQ